jgi:hypothetical protein
VAVNTRTFNRQRALTHKRRHAEVTDLAARARMFHCASKLLVPSSRKDFWNPALQTDRFAQKPEAARSPAREVKKGVSTRRAHDGRAHTQYREYGQELGAKGFCELLC